MSIKRNGEAHQNLPRCASLLGEGEIRRCFTPPRINSKSLQKRSKDKVNAHSPGVFCPVWAFTFTDLAFTSTESVIVNVFSWWNNLLIEC